MIKKLKGVTPQIGEKSFIADNATIVGDVVAGTNCSFWFNSVTRGDVNSIKIGDFTNIQDGAVIHCTYQKASTTVGSYVSIGHNAIIHGCVIEDNVLIGMGAIVMDNAHIGKNSIIAAGAVVLEGTIVEEGSLYAGIPAKKMKMLQEDRIAQMKKTAHNYVLYSSWYQEK